MAYSKCFIDFICRYNPMGSADGASSLRMNGFDAMTWML